MISISRAKPFGEAFSNKDFQQKLCGGTQLLTKWWDYCVPRNLYEPASPFCVGPSHHTFHKLPQSDNCLAGSFAFFFLFFAVFFTYFRSFEKLLNHISSKDCAFLFSLWSARCETWWWFGPLIRCVCVYARVCCWPCKPKPFTNLHRKYCLHCKIFCTPKIK